MSYMLLIIEPPGQRLSRTEAMEMVGGFFLINCRSFDEAVAIARECPAAEWATVEVRALAPCYDDSRAGAAA